MNSTSNARRLRREQTDEEKELWHALRAGRFAGFKFRRQHLLGKYFLDFYCPAAKLSMELDGFQHGLPEERQRDEEREKFLASEGVEELRFWNHQWWENREGILLDIGMPCIGEPAASPWSGRCKTIVFFRRRLMH